MGTAVAERAWSVVVPHQARGARMARHRLAGALDGAINTDLIADAVAVVAELVGNAIRHAQPLPGDVIQVSWRVRVLLERQLIIVQVTDGGAPETPRQRQAELDAIDGRGLAIVAALADRWGVERDNAGQRVWAELSLLIPQVAVDSHAPAETASTHLSAVTDLSGTAIADGVQHWVRRAD